MTFTVEDGTGILAANAYVTAAEYRAYFSLRAIYDAEDGEIEAAIVRATQYIDGKYRRSFNGSRTNGRSQGLEWPREDATDMDGNTIPSTEVPREIKDATCEAAYREIVSTGSLSPDLTLTGSVKRSREKVGPIEEETEYFEGAASADPIFRRIDEILSGLFTIRRNTTSSFLARA